MILKQRRRPTSRRRWLILGLVAILIIGFGGYKFYQSRKELQKPTIPSQQVQTTEPDNIKDSGKQPSPATGSGSSGNSSSGSSSGNSVTLLAPFGSFVSNHNPGKDNAAIEQSVCNTSPGAQCYIQFTKGSSTKKLVAQTTDSNGVTIWDWQIKSAGLSAGSWQVTAVASLNGQTRSTPDPIKLEVGQ